MGSKLYIAGAGAGKTTKIVKEATMHSLTNKNILITTYTIANSEEIKCKLKKANLTIPTNITVQTWISFLLKEGIRPYQGVKFENRIENICSEQKPSIYIKKFSNDYYITKDNKIYLDRIASCVIDLDNLSNGLVFKRIAKLYDYIYIDEIQDLVGYDLEIIKYLIKSGIKVIMFGDPRQCTYRTHNEQKYKKYNNGKVDEFLKKECKGLDIDIDVITLNKTRRNCKQICELANKIFDNFPNVEPDNNHIDNHMGVYLIHRNDVEKYLKKFSPVQLRYNRKTNINNNYRYYNFGESKGLEFDRVIIYPTKGILEWLESGKKLEDKTKCAFYVAVTKSQI